MDKKRRTTLLTLLALGAGYSGLRYVPSLLPEKLVLTDLESPSGFRQYSAGETSSGSFNPFAGLDTDNDLARREAETRADKRVSSNVCRALYAELDLNPDQVPIASFSDYYCPYCRVQTKRLAALAKGNETEFAVAWHELPLLGETSNLAGTPALVIGRTVVQGQISDRMIKRIVEQERAEGWATACGYV